MATIPPPPPPPVDPNHYPASANIGNNCRATAFMIDGAPYGVPFISMFKGIKWRDLITNHFLPRLALPTNVFVHHARKQPIAILLQNLADALDPSWTHQYLLEYDVITPGHPAYGPSVALKALGVFQAWFHVPLENQPDGTLDFTKSQIRTLFQPASEGGDDFFRQLGSWTFKDLLTKKAADNVAKLPLIQKAKDLGVLQIHSRMLFTLPAEDICPGGNTGTSAVRDIETDYIKRTMMETGADSVIFSGPPNGYWCCGGNCAAHAGSYCQGCNAYSDRCP